MKTLVLLFSLFIAIYVVSDLSFPADESYMQTFSQATRPKKSLPMLKATSTPTSSTRLIKVSSSPSTSSPSIRKTVIIKKDTPKPTSSIPVLEKVPPALIPPAILNEKVRSAVVNVFCTSKSGGAFKPITGSGVIIDPRGIILTNAHLGQYLLLKDYLVPDYVSCQIRTGSPAEPRYRASLFYIAPAWVEKNKESVVRTDYAATGEYDYALLRITSAISGEQTLSSSLPFVPPLTAFGSAEKNHPVLLASYPAEYQGAIESQKNLYLISTLATIKDAFYFQESDRGKLDLFSVGGAIVAQKGSSGGAVVDQRTGSLIGIVVTSSEGLTTEEKDLRALSLPHINRSMLSFEGKGLEEILKGDLDSFQKKFEEKDYPRLKQILVDVLNR